MTHAELRNHDQSTIHFDTPEAAGVGTLNYRITDDAFEIIYFQSLGGGGASRVIALSPDMIDAITEENGKLRLSL